MTRRARGGMVPVVCVVLAFTGCTTGEGPVPEDRRAVFEEPSPRPSPSSCAEAGSRFLARASRSSPMIPTGAAGSDGDMAPVSARSVFDFVSSVGVNVHTTYDNTPYGDHDRVEQALRDLGIRHIRDGLVPDRDHDQYPFLRRLADQGICTDLIIGDPEADTDHIGVMLDDLERVAAAVDLIEGPNEPDLALDGIWSDRVPGYQEVLAGRVDQRAGVPDVPLLAPSFGRMGALRAAADLSLDLDVGNLHPYPGGGPPSRHLGDNMDAARELAGDAPLVATEHGYHNATASNGGHPGVPEDVAAVYIPRLFLESFAAGVDRTYLYELVDQFEDLDDDDAESQFGLLRTDFSEKPAATALRNLMTVLGGHAAHPHTTGSVPVQVRSDTDDVRALLLQAADGTWWVALWRQVSVYDEERQQAREVAPADATVTFEQVVDATGFRPLETHEPVWRAPGHAEVRVRVPADPVLIAVRAPGDDR